MEPGNPSTFSDTPVFKDRRTGLLIYGILEIIAGALCAMLVPLMFFAQTISRAQTGARPQYGLILPAVAMYAMLSVVFVMLGIGSIRARRWARALGLILGWSWLLTGSIGLVIYGFALPKVLATAPVGGPPLPAGARVGILVVAMVFTAIIMVLVPLAVVLFYRSPHVRATCQTLNPALCWTDKCPLPALALSLWLAAGAACMALMPLAYHGVAPFFGMLLSGIAGGGFYVCVGIFLGLLARGIYRLNPLAWWLVLAFMTLATISNFLTFERIDIEELYRRMGYPQAQLDQLRALNFLDHKFMAVFSTIGILPMLAYLLYVRQFFRTPSRKQP